jgi:hypothetical protein
MKSTSRVILGAILIATLCLGATGCDSTGPSTTYVSVSYGSGYGPGWGYGWGGYRPGGGVVITSPPVAVPY